MNARLLILSLTTALMAARNPVLAAIDAPAPAAPNAAALALGDAAPPFTAHRLGDGRPVTSADYRGKILVLNFWATWCPPCRHETPDMIAAFRKFGGGDVAFLGVDTTEVPSVVKTFVSAKGLPYPIALAGPKSITGSALLIFPRRSWSIVMASFGRDRRVNSIRSGSAILSRTRALRRIIRSIRSIKRSSIACSIPPHTISARRPIDTPLQPRASRPTSRWPRPSADAHSSGKEATVDYTRTLAEEGALQMAGAQRAMTLATTLEHHVAADRLLAAADGKLNRFGDAIAALRDAQTVAPTDATLDLDIARADYRLHDYDGGISAAKSYTAAVPGDADGWNFLELLDQRSGKFADAAPVYEKTSALLQAKVGLAQSPSDKQDAIANVADEALDLANVYLALGDVKNTQRAFALANEYGNRLDPHGTYANLYTNVHERSQEGLIAVRFEHGDKTALFVVPWTGPDLPGSVASTLKYRLIVASASNGKLDLHAIGLRPGWVASFCADGLCSPNRVSVALPDSGVKTYEFQLVPLGASHVAGKVTIVTSDGITALVPARV